MEGGLPSKIRKVSRRASLEVSSRRPCRDLWGLVVLGEVEERASTVDAVEEGVGLAWRESGERCC